MCFMIFWNQKTCFQTMKTRSLKRRKIEIFPKGLVHGFCQKRAICPSFLFRQYRPGKCFMIFWNQKTCFQPIKTRRLKSRTIEKFPKGLVHGFGQKGAILTSFRFTQYWYRKCVL